MAKKLFRDPKYHSNVLVNESLEGISDKLISYLYSTYDRPRGTPVISLVTFPDPVCMIRKSLSNQQKQVHEVSIGAKIVRMAS